MIQKITAVVFLYQDNKVLIAKRADSKKFLPGGWELPGGHIEFAETMEEGLIREIKEEINIDVIIENPFHAFTYTNDDNTKHTIEVVYFARMSNPNQEIRLNPEDHSEYRWINEEEAKDFFLQKNKEEGNAAIKGFLLQKPMLENNSINLDIKALIFDIGGVLFLAKEENNEKHLLSSFRRACLHLNDFGIDTYDRIDELFSIYRQSSVGEITKEETMNQMSNVLKVSPAEVELLFKRVYKENTIENIELYNFVLSLKENYKLAILSNQFHLSSSVLVPEKYYEKFDALEISSDSNFKKPDERAFLAIIQKLGIKAEECLFIDDKQDNLDVAEKLNMKALLFEDNQQFISDLRKMNIYNK